MANAKWVYIQSETGLYTVGFYAPDSDHALKDRLKQSEIKLIKK
ncbi:hypothetical protein [Solibacillus palustris]|nr:hypothetical protein [Solibacillus sp. MA9]